MFDDRLIVFRKKSGPRVSLRHALSLTEKVRRALLGNAGDAPPEALHGHDAGGGPSRRTHLAVLPLAFVDHRHADGDLKGFAIALPRGLAGDDRAAVLQAIGALRETVVFGRDDVRWSIERVAAEGGPETLRPERWIGRGGSARRWASVTPVVFGRFPRGRGRGWMDGDEARDMVREQLAQIGLDDEPARIEVLEVSPALGVPPSPHFPTISTSGKPILPGRDGPRVPARLRAHVYLEFQKPIRGPLVLGAGRYYGMGLFLPVTNTAGTGGAR